MRRVRPGQAGGQRVPGAGRGSARGGKAPWAFWFGFGFVCWREETESRLRLLSTRVTGCHWSLGMRTPAAGGHSGRPWAVRTLRFRMPPRRAGEAPVRAAGCRQEPRTTDSFDGGTRWMKPPFSEMEKPVEKGGIRKCGSHHVRCVCRRRGWVWSSTNTCQPWAKGCALHCLRRTSLAGGHP